MKRILILQVDFDMNGTSIVPEDAKNFHIYLGMEMCMPQSDAIKLYIVTNYVSVSNCDVLPERLERGAHCAWPLLTVETEVNGDSKSTNERGPSLVGSLALSCQYNRSALAALVGPVRNIFFLTAHYFNSFVPHQPASWAGRRTGSPVSLYVYYTEPYL
jgi:hypothetical protein